MTELLGRSWGTSSQASTTTLATDSERDGVGIGVDRRSDPHVLAAPSSSSAIPQGALVTPVPGPAREPARPEPSALPSRARRGAPYIRKRSWLYAAVKMTRQLRAARVLDPQWSASFCEVPRHLFVDRCYTRSPLGWQRQDRLDVVNGVGGRAWLNRTYAATPLVTEVSTANARTDAAEPVVVMPAPATLAAMLRALEVTEPVRVLEVGTGTGYTAALLCHLLGDRQVTSMDIDPTQTHAAQARLAAQGMTPRLEVGDSTLGLPDGAWDRIIVSHAIDQIPTSWLHHLTPGGVLVAQLTGALGAQSIIALRRTDESMGGFFLSRDVEEIAPTRRSVAAAFAQPSLYHDYDEPARRDATRLNPAGLTPRSPRTLIAQLRLPPGTVRSTVVDDTVDDAADNGELWTQLNAPDGSWARISHTRRGHTYAVHGSGPTDLRDALEHTYTEARQLNVRFWSDLRLVVTDSAATVTTPFSVVTHPGWSVGVPPVSPLDRGDQ